VSNEDQRKHDVLTPSDEALMLAYVAGDATAFRLLFDRYNVQVMRLARRRVRTDDEARDIVQLAFLHLHRARSDFRPDAKLRPWLFTIAMNLVREHHRRRGRRPETLMEPERLPEPSRVDPALASDVTQRVQQALSQLPAGQREVIELHWLNELPYEEVAVIVGASVAAVRVRAHRGYAALRDLLKGM
jgi:RNA polymerase sigma factor (sigma-70 family)